MRRLFPSVLAAMFFAAGAHAQSDASGPFVTPAGSAQFERVGGDYVASLDGTAFDRFGARALVHFDDEGEAGQAVARMLVATDSGPALYDFRRRPPLVERTGKRMNVQRVFWQGDEVVMQSPEGWYRFKGGILTKLQSSKTIYR